MPSMPPAIRRLASVSWPQRLAQALELLAHDQAWAATLADRDIDGWGNGGCLILAEAVRLALGPQARLIGIRERRGRRIEHVAVECDGWFIDLYGVRDLSDLLYDAQTIGGYRDPTLAPFVLPADAQRHRIPYGGQQDLINRLGAQLSSALGPDLASAKAPRTPRHPGG